jgi:hypothetical protein
MRADLKVVNDRTYQRVYRRILAAMTSYTEASKLMEQSLEPRDEFTEALFFFLNAAIGYDYNPDGSFTSAGAKRAIEDEGSPWWGDLSFGFDVNGRFERLENGEVNFAWIWQSAMSDYVHETWWVDRWQPIIGHKRVAILKKGPPTSSAKRPYIGKIMEVNAPKHADSIHRAIQKNLKGRGFKFVSRRSL